MQEKAKQKIRGYIFKSLNYLPGLIILFFGMVALHASLLQINEKQQLYQTIQNAGLSVEIPPYFQQKNGIIWNGTTGYWKNIFHISELRLYWSVIILGGSGFVLLLLNTSKLQKLSAASKDKKAALHLLENRLAAMESASDGIAILDGNGKISYLNKAFKTLHDIDDQTSETYIGKSWDELYDIETQSVLANEIMTRVFEIGVWRDEISMNTAKGKTLELGVSLNRLSDGGMIGTIRDISERRKSESEKDDIQKQFFQAQKMEAIGRLAGGIAHDFNNILAAINGYAEFLIDDLDKKTPQHKFASNIMSAGHQAKSLVDQMLAFSRTKNDDFEIFDINTPIIEGLTMLEASLPKTVELSSDIAKDPLPVMGNSTQISQTFLNLCVNAKDAMDNEKGTIEICIKQQKATDLEFQHLLQNHLPDPQETPFLQIEEISPENMRLFLGKCDANRDYVILSIKDNGSGMPRDVLEHAFEPFFTTKAVDKGTGLGLSTVHGIIQSHQAVLMIDTILGEGTHFMIGLPMEQRQKIRTISQETITDPTEILSGKNILLVEDQDDVADVTMTMLQRIGVNAKRSISGLEALDELRENIGHYDVVLTDQNMPKMTGIELIYEVESDGMDIPFILLSGYSQKKLYTLLQQHDAVKFMLRKPVKQQDLALKIAEVLKDQEA